MRNLHNNTKAEIEKIIFADASPSEPRALSDRLTESEILSLPDHPCYRNWDSSFKDWIWSAIDQII